MVRKSWEIARDARKLNVPLLNFFGISLNGEDDWNRGRFSFFLFWLFFIASSFFVGLFYDWGKWLTICELLQGAPLIFTLIGRLLSLFKEVNDGMHSNIMYEYTKCFFKNEANLKYQNVLVSGALLVEKAMKSMMFLYCIIFMIPCCTAFFESLFKGDNIYMLPIKIAFIDPQTNFWFYETFSVTASLLVYACFVITENAILYCSFLTIPFVDVLVIKVDELGCQLTELRLLFQSYSKHQLSRTILDVEKDFIDIIEQFNEYRDYVDRLQIILTTSGFTAVAANGLGMGLAIIVLTSTSIPRGLAFMLLFIFQVANICIAGTIITHQNERLLQAVCDFPWYELSREKRKIYLQFLCICQDAIDLDLPMIGICDMELFKDVVYAGYNYYMFIINFVKF